MHNKPRNGTRFIVVSGGVISGVGKGVTTASIGKIFIGYGFKTTLIKVDPYINFDAGTLRPTEHGEVWVTQDGGEIDQDLGTYERFIDADIPRRNNITTGQIYKAVIDRERRGEYLGQTVQFIPHIIDEVVNRIKKASEGYDIAIVEIGGTVGDYENAPFLFALKSLERDLGIDHVMHMLVTYLPVPDHIGEMKTKPTQQAIRLLGQHGIMPDFIICRAEFTLDKVRRQKIVEFAHINPNNVIAAPNVRSVYEIPLAFEKQELGKKMLAHFSLKPKKQNNWDDWKKRVTSIIAPKKSVRIGMVCKYLDTGAHSLTDSYLSVYHALIHAGAAHDVGIDIAWINAKEYEKKPESIAQLSACDALIVPGGFGSQGVNGKLAAIEYARQQGIPFLGLCYGFQLAVVEYARSVCKLDGAHTTEVDSATAHPVIDILPLQKQYLQDKAYGGTMRLGGYTAQLRPQSRVASLYAVHAQNKKPIVVSERHRHRYEVNPAYVTQLEKAGLLFSGVHTRVDGTQLMEFLELPNHPFFIATQAHPEFTSRFAKPNPLFAAFVKVAMEQRDKGKQLYKAAQISYEMSLKV